MSSRLLSLVALAAACAQPLAPKVAPTPRTLRAAFDGAFLVGVALNAAQFSGRDTLGAAIVTAQFNATTPENALKWASLHPRPGTYDFAAADPYVAFGERNGMFIVGHNLVWHNQTPRWVFEDSRSEEHTSELQSPYDLVCRLLLEKKNNHHRSQHSKENDPTEILQKIGD